MPSVNKVTFLWLCELIWVNKCSFQFLCDCVLFKSRSSINRIYDVFLIQLLIKQSRRAGHHCTFNRVYENTLFVNYEFKPVYCQYLFITIYFLKFHLQPVCLTTVKRVVWLGSGE